jgi:hypothetical protein
VPDAVKPSKMQFTSLSGFAADTGEWLIP